MPVGSRTFPSMAICELNTVRSRFVANILMSTRKNELIGTIQNAGQAKLNCEATRNRGYVRGRSTQAAVFAKLYNSTFRRKISRMLKRVQRRKAKVADRR